MVDWEIILPVVFLLLVPLAFVCAGLALYQYLRFESSADIPQVALAMAAFAVHYGLAFLLILASTHRYVLLPTILMFLTTVALMTVTRLGFQAHSKAGLRIGLAGLFSLCAYICLFITEYREFHY
jgi:hypothetical protein